MKSTRLLILMCILAAASAVFAANHHVLLVSRIEPRAALPSNAMNDANARVVAAYDAMFALKVPSPAVTVLVEQLRHAGFEVEDLPSTIHLQRRTIDTEKEAPPHTAFDEGLYILQFIAPALPEWLEAITDFGVEIVEPIPERAAIVTGSRSQIARLQKFDWVQYAGPFLHLDKVVPTDGPEYGSYVVQYAETSRSVAAITDLRSRVDDFEVISRYGVRTTARIVTSAATVEELAAQPFLLSAEREVPMQPSDERQGLGLTGITAPNGSRYLTWLANKGIQPSDLTNSGIVIDIADTGIDTGCGGGPGGGSSVSHHRDLRGRIVYHGGAPRLAPETGFAGDNRDPRYRDRGGHGSVVAGVAGGSPGTGVDISGAPTTGYSAALDPTYYYGLGVAPGIRIGNTVIVDGAQTIGNVAGWTTRAVTQYCNTAATPCTTTAVVCGATVQNFSSNEYSTGGTNAGRYTVRAQEMDISVRNAGFNAVGRHVLRHI